MTVDKNELMQAVEKAMLAVDAKTAGFDLLHFDVDTITASNAYMSASVPFKFDIENEMSVKAQDFQKMLAKFASGTLDISFTDKVIIKAGKARATLSLIAYENKSNWPLILPDSYVELPENFMDVLERCYIPSNTSQLSGIYIVDILMASTDRAKMNLATLDSSMPMLWLHDTTVKALLKVKDFTHYIVRNGVFALRSESATFMLKVLNAENYPIKVIQQYDTTVSEAEVEEFELPEGLVDAIKRASPMSEKTEEGAFISLEFREDGVIVSSSKTNGTYEETVEFDCTIETMPLLLDVRHLLYGLGRGSTAKLVKTERNGDVMQLFVIENIDSRHILVVAG